MAGDDGDPGRAGTRRPRVLISAYACEPGRGSEPGAGWGVVRAVAEVAEVVVLVGAEHRPGLEDWRREHPEDPVRFVVVAEPRWGARALWHRVPRFLVYLAWVRRAGRVARDLHARDPVEVVMHVSFAVHWLPAPGRDLGVPFVLGPAGGAVTTPVRLWPVLGPAGVAADLADRLGVRLGERLPSTRRTWRAADAVLVQNRETQRRLPTDVRRRSRVLNHACLAEGPAAGSRPAPGAYLHLGALESRKGVGLVLRALAQVPGATLDLVGEGPERDRLEALAQRLGIGDRARFRGRLPHAEVMGLLASAGAVLFAGVREEGGIGLAEALLAGAPVIVLDHGGAAAVVDRAVDPARVQRVPVGRSVADTVAGLAAAMVRWQGTAPQPAHEGNLDVAGARAELARVLAEVRDADGPGAHGPQRPLTSAVGVRRRMVRSVRRERRSR
jgi:glycosyltransferase involved in cell wall biosynthesis